MALRLNAMEEHIPRSPPVTHEALWTIWSSCNGTKYIREFWYGCPGGRSFFAKGKPRADCERETSGSELWTVHKFFSPNYFFQEKRKLFSRIWGARLPRMNRGNSWIHQESFQRVITYSKSLFGPYLGTLVTFLFASLRPSPAAWLVSLSRNATSLRDIERARSGLATPRPLHCKTKWEQKQPNEIQVFFSFIYLQFIVGIHH